MPRPILASLAALVLATPALADVTPDLDPARPFDASKGYCEWITVYGTKPAEVTIADDIYWRSRTSEQGSGELYGSFGLFWGNIHAIRLRCNHPLYAKLKGAAPVPVATPAPVPVTQPTPLACPSVASELAAIRGAVSAIEGKVR